MVSQVEILSKEIIKPSYPTPVSLKHLKLSFLDRSQVFNYGPIVLFYRNQGSSRNDRPQRSQQLKQSLSETLTKFYPFAGRINGNFSVDCNDSGALFVEAEVHADLSDAIRSATTTDISQYLPLDTFLHIRNDTSNYFQLSVQISFFQCGGVGVGACLLHAIADAYTFATVMDSWAAKCSGRAETVRPNFHIGFSLFPTTDTPIEQVEGPEAEEEKIVTSRFVFDADTVARMKKQISSRSGTHNPTRVETVSAFIWKHFIDITRSKTASKRAFAFHVVDLRRRSSPALPDAMGNFSVLTVARYESEEAGDYCNLVAPLRTAITNVDGDYLKDEQKRSEYLDLVNLCDPQKGRCIFTSLCKSRFYDVDYGWGKPFAVCTRPLPIKNSVILMDTRCGGGVVAWISMVEDEMAMLPTDFLSLEDNDFV